MSLAATLRRGKVRTTNQAIADMALQLDQQRRDALKAGNINLALTLELEIAALTDMVS